MAHAPVLPSSDLARLLWRVVAPMVLGGSVSPNPGFTPYLVRRQATAREWALLERIRERHGPRVWCWFPPAWTLLVLDADGIAEILRSDANFADPPAKTLLLSAFTPNGVIVSRGDAWLLRRALNDDVLAFGQLSHPGSQEFLDIVDGEVERLLNRRTGVLVWSDFAELAERVTQQVIFGRGQFDAALARHMHRVVAASNWAIRRRHERSAVFNAFREQLERESSGAPEAALAGRCRHWLETHRDSRESVEAVGQMGFWLFVVKDAIELHVTRTLALIASAPEGLCRRIREQFPARGPASPDDVHRAALLEGCIKEGLRLWTPVPLLLRRVSRDTTFDNTPLQAGQQILIHAGFYHRDRRVFGPGADRFDPEARSRGDRSDERSITNSSPPLYIFSRFRQGCVGQFLAMYLLKATLCSLLRRAGFSLLEPPIPLDPVPPAIDPFRLRFAWRPLGN